MPKPSNPAPSAPTPFQTIAKSAKKRLLPKLIKLIKYGIALIGLALLFCYIAGVEGLTKPWSYLATIALAFFPNLFRLMGLKISKGLELAYLIFIIFAMVLGIDCSLYEQIYISDKLVHFGSGVLSAIWARDILKQASAQPDKLWFKILWALCFTAGIAVAWEIFEFACDQLLGQHMQELIVAGLDDTMWDMITAIVAGIITVSFLYPPKNQRN